MFEKPEDPADLFEEIKESGEGWRAEHLNLPVTLLFLSRIKRALAGLEKDSSAHKVWSELKARGKSLARRRALFVATEAVGHLRRGAQAGERETIRKALGVVVEEGTTLDKVRALRAVSFIPSDECVPILKRGMQDRSAWVQATALNILLNMNLQRGAPRKVLTDFLHDRVERQAQREEVLNPRAVVKNFHVNKGLFLALLKAPGGKRLALLSLRLWFKSTLLIAFVLLQAGADAVSDLQRPAAAASDIPKAAAVAAPDIPKAAAGAAFGLLRDAASAIFFKLPRQLIVNTPTLLLKTLVVLYWLFIWSPYKILTTPLWARHLERSFGVLREPHFYLALLDYIFIYLLVASVQPYGWIRLTLALTFYWALIASSSDIENGRTAEQFRLFSRGACAALLAWYTSGAGQDDRLVLALASLAAAHVIWLRPLLTRGFAAFLAGLVFVLRGIARALTHLIMTDAKNAVEELWEKAPPRERLLSEAASLTGGWLRALWQKLRPNLTRLAVRALVVVLFLGTAYYAMRSANLSISDASRLTGPELGPLLVSLKPYLYFVLGGLVVAIPCAVFLIAFYLLWDELWIVERVTFRTRSRNVKKFKSDNEFLAYVFQLVRDQTLSAGLRVRAAAALAQVPLASQEYVDQLTDLAEEEGLPASVSDAVSKVADEAEKRLTRRARQDEFNVDTGLVDRQLEGIWMPGEVLRPWIRKVLAAILLPSLFAGAVGLYFWSGESLAEMVSLGCLGLGCGLILLYIFTARRQSEFVKWSLLYGLILLVSGFTRPLHIPLYEAGWNDYYANGLVGLVDVSAISALIVPVMLAGLVAQVGHTVYLLGSDVGANLDLKGKHNLFKRKFERLERQAFIVRPVLTFALCAMFAQSQPLKEYLDRRGEKMPSFAANGKEAEVELKGIPTDGRVVRVAMVDADDRAGPGVSGDPVKPSADETRAAIKHSLQDGGLFPLEAKNVWGDVWITSHSGKVRGWATSPIRCLEPSAVAGNIVTFNLHSLCTYNSKVRLVAIVYDKKRSDFIMGMSVRESEAAADVNTVYPSDSWLLLDTNSPFVKAVWSPVF